MSDPTRVDRTPIIEAGTQTRVRAAIQDRAIWFALLYRSYAQELDQATVERCARQAIWKFGTHKGRLDGPPLDAKSYLGRFVTGGGADLFGAIITPESHGALNTVGHCALVEGWKAINCSTAEIALFCDIAMEGDRARAAHHGLDLELGETIGNGCASCAIRLIDREQAVAPAAKAPVAIADPPPPKPSELALVRAALKDRAVWLALLYREFAAVLPAATLEAQTRAAITEFGHVKGARDTQPFDHREWVRRHRDKGSAEVFDSLIETHEDHSIQQMRYCPLMEGWRELGCSAAEMALFCDMAMDGDRGRAAYHGVPMELVHTMPAGAEMCRLIVHVREKS